MDTLLEEGVIKQAEKTSTLSSSSPGGTSAATTSTTTTTTTASFADGSEGPTDSNLPAGAHPVSGNKIFAKLDCGERKYLVYNTFNGLPKIHLRQFEWDHFTGTEYASKCGLTLSISAFSKLVSNMEDVKAAVEQMREKKEVDLNLHLGGKVYVRVRTPYLGVSVRLFFVLNGQILPSKYGLMIKLKHFDKFASSVKQLSEMFPTIAMTENICELSHDNQESLFSCKFCTPFFDPIEL